MRQRRDRRGFTGGDLRQTGKAVATVDVHRAGAANALPARSAESERRIHFVLDLDQGVQNHGTALLEIDLEILKFRLGRVIGIPSVD